MTTQEIRTLLYNRMKQVSFMMDKGMIAFSYQKAKAIEDLRLRLDSIEQCSLHVHYRWILKLRNQVIDLLPSEHSKLKTQREKILQLLREAEQKINADYTQRIAVR